MLNANKRSVTLNLKHPRGREIILKLIEDADVLVENYSAGVMESFGLAYEDLRGRFPRLIYASAKGYASDGPWARLGAMDSTVQASSGFMSVTGYPDRSGVKTPATFIDMGTGSHLVSGILAALLQRERSGRGQKVEVAMLDVCVPALTGLIADHLQGRAPERLGNRHRNACPSDVYPAADGEILIFCLTEPHWRSLTRLLGREEELTGDPRFKNHASRLANVREVDRAVAGWTRGHAPRGAYRRAYRGGRTVRACAHGRRIDGRSRSDAQANAARQRISDARRDQGSGIADQIVGVAGGRASADASARTRRAYCRSARQRRSRRGRVRAAARRRRDLNTERDVHTIYARAARA